MKPAFAQRPASFQIRRLAKAKAAVDVGETDELTQRCLLLCVPYCAARTLDQPNKLLFGGLVASLEQLDQDLHRHHEL